jgi:hypothetical protein
LAAGYVRFAHHRSVTEEPNMIALVMPATLAEPTLAASDHVGRYYAVRWPDMTYSSTYLFHNASKFVPQ